MSHLAAGKGKRRNRTPQGHRHTYPQRNWEQVKLAAREVGPGLFVALLVITVSFVPVYALESQAGRLIKPVAFTKTPTSIGKLASN